MPNRKKPRPLTLAAPAEPVPTPPGLPLGGGRGVELVLKGADLAAVEAAAAELKARFGPRFAVLGRRSGGKRAGLRISASLLVRPDDALDAELG